VKENHPSAATRDLERHRHQTIEGSPRCDTVVLRDVLPHDVVEALWEARKVEAEHDVGREVIAALFESQRGLGAFDDACGVLVGAR